MVEVVFQAGFEQFCRQFDFDRSHQRFGDFSDLLLMQFHFFLLLQLIAQAGFQSLDIVNAHAGGQSVVPHGCALALGTLNGHVDAR